jgi:protein ImuA
MMNIAESYPALAQLKGQIAALAPAAGTGQLGRVSFGLPALDARLDGGLARGAVHEVLPESAADTPSACAFALMMAARTAEAGGRILWITSEARIRREGVPYGPGLAELGVAPDQVLIATVPDELAALKAAGDTLRCPGLAAALIDMGPARRLDLTASRRLALASAQSGVTAFVLRDRSSVIASAAASRWQVAAAPSVPLPGQAPGPVTLALALVRHRGGVPPFNIVVEWTHDDRSFREPTLLRRISAPVERRQMVA